MPTHRLSTAAVLVAVAVAPLLQWALPSAGPTVGSAVTAPSNSSRLVSGRPLAATRSGVVAQAPNGTLGLVPLSGGRMTALTSAPSGIGEAWGCGNSFAGLKTIETAQGWQSTVVWVDTATRQTARRSVPPTQRVLGASPRGFVVADVNTGTTGEIQGATGARTEVAPFADTWACDESGYAWTQSTPGAWTEKAYRRSWSAVTATPALLLESPLNIRLLSLSGGVALVSDSRRDWQTTRPTDVSLTRVSSGVSPVVLWSGTDAVLEGAVTSGTTTYLRVSDRSSGAAVSRTLVRNASGTVRAVALPIPGAASTTPLAATGGGGAVVGVAGRSGGLFTLGGSAAVRIATWVFRDPSIRTPVRR